MSENIKGFTAHCPNPKCGVVVDETNVIETRRQKVARWGKAITAAGWAVVKYPVQPFSATNKIVALEAKVVQEVARVEDKVEKQGQMIVQRLDIQDKVLTGIGGMISNIQGESQAFIPVSPPVAQNGYDGLPIGAVWKGIYHRSEVRGIIKRHDIFFDTEKRIMTDVQFEFFRTMCGKTRAEANFAYDLSLVCESQLAVCKRIAFTMYGAKLSKQVAMDFMRSVSLEMRVQGDMALCTTLLDIYEGRVHVAGIIIPGGRSTEMRCYRSTNQGVALPESEISMRLSLDCVVADMT